MISSFEEVEDGAYEAVKTQVGLFSIQSIVLGPKTVGYEQSIEVGKMQSMSNTTSESWCERVKM